MSGISEHRLRQVKGFIAALPESPLRALDGALALTRDPALLQVHQIISEEREQRQTKLLVFAPYAPLFETRHDDLNSVLFPKWLIDNIWRMLGKYEPNLMAEAQFVARGLSRTEATPVIFFRLVTAAAELLRNHTDEALPRNPARDDQAEIFEFAEYLDLHRVIIDALSKLPQWMGRIDAEKAASLRVLYKDACLKSEDSGARFMEVLFANLDDGVQVMKLISAVVDKPSDRFLAESELADFGERIIERIEESIQGLRVNLESPFRADADPHEAGQAVAGSLGLMYALEQAIELSRDGPWGQRISLAHKTVAALVETRLKSIEKAVEKALPSKPSRGGLPRPRLEAALNDLDMAKARALLTFMADVRIQAQHGGYATLHAKTVQAVEVQLTSYFEDLLYAVNNDEPYDAERLELFFNAVLDMLEAGYGDERANLARRRIASSGLYRNPDEQPGNVSASR